MLASAAARCLVVADVFCIVMEVVGCVGGLLNEADAQGRHDFTSAAKPASARDTPPTSVSKTRTVREGTATPLRLFGMIGATSSCGSHA